MSFFHSTERWRLPVHFLLLVCGALAFYLLPLKSAKAWEIAAIRAPDGGVVFCRAELFDRTSNLTLALALSPQQEVNVGVKVPDAGFTRGEGFDVTLGLDNDWRKKVVAESATEDLLLMRLGTDKNFLQRFAKANTLRVVGDADATEFTLKGSAKAVEQLRACLAAAPRADAQMALAGGAPLPAGLAALLQASGLNFTPVALPNVAGRVVDFAWTSRVQDETVEGGFREQTGTPDTFKAQVQQLLEKQKQECAAGGAPARVQTGKPERLASLQLQTAEITCGQEFAAFLFYRTHNGIFALLVQRTALAGSVAARAGRDQIAATVRRLGQENNAEGAQP